MLLTTGELGATVRHVLGSGQGLDRQLEHGQGCTVGPVGTDKQPNHILVVGVFPVGAAHLLFLAQGVSHSDAGIMA